jgi:glycerophosphoryl diester phosphodiesterase
METGWIWGIAGGIVFAVGLYLFLIAPGYRSRISVNDLFTQHYAHRGLYTRDQRVPENSMAAFRAAVDAGLGFELDLTLSEDGQVIVFHDDTLKRACGVDMKIESVHSDDLDAYKLFGTQETIPLFEDVLRMTAGKVPLIIELKYTLRREELCLKTAALLQHYEGPYCIESFDPVIVRWFAINRHETVRGQLLSGQEAKGRQYYRLQKLAPILMLNVFNRPHFVAYYYRNSRRRLAVLRLYKMLGGKLVAWTVSDTADLEYCLTHFHALIFEHLSLPSRMTAAEWKKKSNQNGKGQPIA